MTFLKFKLRNNLLSSEASIHKKGQVDKTPIVEGKRPSKNRTGHLALTIYMSDGYKDLTPGREA